MGELLTNFSNEHAKFVELFFFCTSNTDSMLKRTYSYDRYT